MIGPSLRLLITSASCPSEQAEAAGRSTAAVLTPLWTMAPRILYELFERVLIGLYEQAGERRGAVRFFDVKTPPSRGMDDRPKTRRSASTKSSS